MKKKIYILLIIISGILLVGCTNSMTAREAVRDYLEMYVTLDNKVIEQIDEYVENEEFNEEQKKIYKEILKKEYSTLSYEILNETYDGDVAYVKTKVKVMDLYKVQKDSSDYYENHKKEFNDEKGIYDKSKFLTYKLKQMMDATETTTYEIEFKVIKEDNNWNVSQLSNEDLEKIHGIYKYEE